MTVKELRKALAGLKPDMTVCVKTEDGAIQVIESAQVGKVWDSGRGNTDALVLLVFSTSLR